MRTKSRKPGLSKADYERLAAFRAALRAVLHRSEAAAKALGLSSIHFEALLAIAGCPDRDSLTIGELASRLYTAHHSAVGLVDRMEKAKIVQRRTSSEDRRRVEVVVTPRGRTLLEALQEHHRLDLSLADSGVGAKLRRLAREL